MGTIVIRLSPCTTYNLLNQVNISVALSYRSELVVEGAGQSLIMGNQQTTANPTATTNPKALPLLSACQKRDMETVSILLASSSMDHLHAVGECGRTPVLLASALGSLPVLYDSASRTQFLGYLLSRGARVSDRDNDGWTPLHHCCAAGDLDGVRLLIENGGDPDATNNQGIRAIEFLDRDYVVPGRVAVPEYAEIQLRQSSQSLRDSSSPTSSRRRAAPTRRRKKKQSSSTGFEEEDDIENDFDQDFVEEEEREDEEGEETEGEEKEETYLDLGVESEVEGSGDSNNSSSSSSSRSSSSPGSTSWKIEYCSLRVPEVVRRGDPLTVHFTRGDDGCDGSDASFVQLYYVDSKPWLLRKRVGSYQKFPPGRQSGTLTFSTKRLSANGKFRILYHGTDRERRVVCASNVVKIQDPGMTGRSLVEAALCSEAALSRGEVQSPKVLNDIDSDEFSIYLDEERSWSLPIGNEEYDDEIMQLAQDESLWLAALKNPPTTDYTFDLIMSKVDIAMAMEDDSKLIGVRFRLVPCWMSEHEFWRVYFWKISQLRTKYLFRTEETVVLRPAENDDDDSISF